MNPNRNNLRLNEINNKTFKKQENINIKRLEKRVIPIQNDMIPRPSYNQINNISKIDFFEGVYNLDCKYYENTEVIKYCKENNILFTAYQPLRRNKIAQKDYPILKEISEKYNKTQNQIMINWLVKEKEIMPLIKSF